MIQWILQHYIYISMQKDGTIFSSIPIFLKIVKLDKLVKSKITFKNCLGIMWPLSMTLTFIQARGKQFSEEKYQLP